MGSFSYDARLLRQDSVCDILNYFHEEKDYEPSLYMM